MSDNNKISLEDRGWGQMSTVLDSELPQKRKRRPVFWLFLVGWLLISFILFINQKDHNPTPNSEVKQPLFTNLSKNSNDDHKISDIERQKDALLIAQKLKPDHVFNSDLSKGQEEISALSQTTIPSGFSKIKEKSYYSVKQNVSNKPVSLENKEVGIEENSVLEQVDNKIFVKSNTSVAASHITPALKVRSGKDLVELAGYDRRGRYNDDVEIRQYLSCNSLPVANFRLKILEEPSYNNPLNLDVISPVDLSKPIEKNRNYYVFAGGQMGLNSSGYGYQLGIGRKFSNRNFSFYIEAGYSQIDYKVGDVEVKSIESEFDLIESSIISESLVDQANSAVQFAVGEYIINNEFVITNLSSAFLTLGIDRSLSRKFNVTGGMTISKFLTYKNQEVKFISSNGQYQEIYDQYHISSAYLSESGKANKYELSAKFGAAYQLTPRLKLSLNYNLGITNLLGGNNYSNPISIENDLGSSSEANKPGRSSKAHTCRKNAECRIAYSF